MDTMKIGNKDYNIIDYMKVKSTGQTIPVVDIPMMSDEDWNRGARDNAVHNYRKEFGKDPESIDQAVEWQRRKVEELTGGSVDGEQ